MCLQNLHLECFCFFTPPPVHQNVVIIRCSMTTSCLLEAPFDWAGLCCPQTPYLHFIHEIMRAFPTRPIILLESRHVSVCLHWKAHSTDAMALAAKEILHKHGWQQAAFIGHSYGTFVMSRIAQLHQSIVQSMVRLPFFSPCRNAQALLALNVKQMRCSNLTLIEGPRANSMNLICHMQLTVLHPFVAQVLELGRLCAYARGPVPKPARFCGGESIRNRLALFGSMQKGVPTQDKSRANV